MPTDADRELIERVRERLRDAGMIPGDYYIAIERWTLGTLVARMEAVLAERDRYREALLAAQKEGDTNYGPECSINVDLMMEHINGALADTDGEG